jgi:hypothetical protein
MKSNIEERIIDSLDSRIHYAQKTLMGLCRNRKLSKFLKGMNHWAIVGGAVRDTLLVSNYQGSEYFSDWADLDIALTHFPSYNLIKRKYKSRSSISITQNHFGGLKVAIQDFGQLDLWHCKGYRQIGEGRQFWLDQLELVDFGINAVAFTWPACQLIMHPRWKYDLEHHQIEKLAKDSPVKEFQPIRAIALAAKLEQKLNARIVIGSSAKYDLAWLLHEANSDVVDRSLAYLEDKIKTGRWPKHTIKRFMESCVEITCSENVLQRISAIASKYLPDDYKQAE